MRVARLFVFFSNTLLILYAIALCIIVYLISSEQSPFGSYFTFPDNIHKALIGLAVGNLVAGIIGCFGSYKAHPIPLLVYFLMLIGLVCGQIIVGKIAKDTPIFSDERAKELWLQGDDNFRRAVQRNLRCCGFTNVTGRDELEQCPATWTQTCDQAVGVDSLDQMKYVAWVLWGVCAIHLFALVSSFALIIASTRKRSDRKSQLLAKGDYF